MIYVKRPNLPQNADCVLVGEVYSNLLENALIKNGIRPIFVPKNTLIDPRLSGHCDLSLFYAGDNRIFAAKYLENSTFHRDLKMLGFSLSFPQANLDIYYPKDCAFNICLSGDHLIYNSSTASNEIISYVQGLNAYKEIVCRQGYAKCLVCPVDDRSIITSDKGIAAACIDAGLDVLEISQGYIDLEGFDYGFIGGASFKLSENKMAFTGVLDQHPDRLRILDFLSDREVEPVFLTDRNIFDVGSILPITEKPR